MIVREERIGDCRLILGDCLAILPTLGHVDAILTDPPFSGRTHAGHDAGQGRDSAQRRKLGYSAMTPHDVAATGAAFASTCGGWICWISDHSLAPHIETAMRAAGRYVFAPLPFFHPGRSVRLTGDGPSSWTDWIICSRTAKQMKWGTLPGGYVAGEGWSDKQRMGGKPLRLMEAMVRDYSRPGDLVLDPFMGGGTTLVACAKSGRPGIGIEIDAETFDRACKRVEDAYRQPDMFVPRAPAPQQEAMDL